MIAPIRAGTFSGKAKTKPFSRRKRAEQAQKKPVGARRSAPTGWTANIYDAGSKDRQQSPRCHPYELLILKRALSESDLQHI